MKVTHEKKIDTTITIEGDEYGLLLLILKEVRDAARFQSLPSDKKDLEERQRTFATSMIMELEETRGHY